MLRGVVLSEVLRKMSGPADGVVMCRGSVGADLNGVAALAGAAGIAGGSALAAVGVSGGWAARVDACEGVRDIMVGTGVGLGAGRVYTGLRLEIDWMHWAVASCCHQRTFWKQAIVARLGVLPQEPPVAEVIVTFYELDSVASSQAELIGAPRNKLVCGGVSVVSALGCITCRRSYERRRGCRPVCTAPCGTAACWRAGGREDVRGSLESAVGGRRE